jgi:hypothetical protein
MGIIKLPILRISTLFQWGKIYTLEFIFNYSGLGAAKLTKDQALVPVQGHLMMLKNQILEYINYMILVYFA